MQFSHPLQDIPTPSRTKTFFLPSSSPPPTKKNINPPPLPPQHQLPPLHIHIPILSPSLPFPPPPFPPPPFHSPPFHSPPPPFPPPHPQNVRHRLQPLLLRLLDPDRGHAQAVRADQAPDRRPAPVRVLPRLPDGGAAEQVQDLDDGLHGAFWVSLSLPPPASPPSGKVLGYILFVGVWGFVAGMHWLHPVWVCWGVSVDFGVGIWILDDR